MGRSLVVGVDAGATSTRCVVATLDGLVVGRGAAGGANRNSSGGQVSETLGTALAAALSEVDGTAVRLGVLGAAGSAGAGREAFRAAATQAWTRAGLGGEVITVTDLEVAFAAGTADPDGALLLSGTGALAARFAGGELVQRSDGYGWLLGDEGSAVWIGLRALRAVLAALDGRGEPTALVELAAGRLGIGRPGGPPADQDADSAQPGDPPQPGGWGRGAREDVGHPGGSSRSAGEDVGQPGGLSCSVRGDLVEFGRLSRAQREELAQAVVAAGFARPAAGLGLLAPVVSAAADAGDPVARRIADAAAGKLLRTFDAVAPPGVGGVVVLAGSVLLTPGPVARAVRDGVLARTGAVPREAVDGAGGAAALAVARLTGGPVPAAVHARLTGGARGHDPFLE